LKSSKIRSLAKAALFLILPIALMELVGLIACPQFRLDCWGPGSGGLPNLWYRPELSHASPEAFIFIGSSHVQAAIDTEAFEREIARRGGPEGPVLNLGYGYSSTAEHYFALRDMFESRPEAMRGCTVLFEAPDGLPDNASLADSWTHPAAPKYIVPLLSRGDLPGLWSSPGTLLENKAEISLLVVSGGARLAVRAQSAANWVLESIAGKIAFRTLHFIFGPPPTIESPRADLTVAGGILADERDVKRVRRIAVELAQKDEFDQKPVGNWSETLVARIAGLVQEHGGKFVVFYMPLSTLWMRAYSTPIRVADREMFERMAAQMGVPTLRPRFASADADFPDLMHLRQSRAAEFSLTLADAYMDRIAAPRLAAKIRP
jgi:hypothetical protein